jgi:hypothetical protein
MKIPTFDKGYAIIIGVGADLPVTINDANGLYNIFSDPNRAGYLADNIFLLTGEEATREKILASFDVLRQKTQSNPDSTIIIYYSGHGGFIEDLDGKKEYFLLPFGFDRNRHFATCISGKEFTEQIEYLNAKKLVVFLDCCHAAGIPTVKSGSTSFKPFPIPSELIEALESGTGKVIVASSYENEFSYTDNMNSVFTDCLLSALNGKDTRGEDGFIHILEVLIYLFKQVPQKAPGPQHPYVKKILDLGDNFSICLAPPLINISPNKEPMPITTTPQKKKRLEQQLEMLQQEWELRVLKIKKIREALILETDILAKFKLEHLLLKEEAEMATISAQMDLLENSVIN